MKERRYALYVTAGNVEVSLTGPEDEPWVGRKKIYNLTLVS